LHQNESTVVRSAAFGRHAATVRWAAVLLIASAPARAAEAPSAAMLEPVHNLVQFMSTLPAGRLSRVFARRGLCIIENFAPFVFCGPHAASLWEAGFRAHSREEALSELALRFDAAYDFGESDNRAYFSLPTTWTGVTNGKHFEEHGAWAFVVVREAAGWRIVGYGWGVTGYTETP
jgi:hypothetical protein